MCELENPKRFRKEAEEPGTQKTQIFWWFHVEELQSRWR